MTPEELGALSERTPRLRSQQQKSIRPKVDESLPVSTPLPSRGTRNGWPTTAILVLADVCAILTGLTMAAIGVAWFRDAWGWLNMDSARLAIGYTAAMFLGLQAQGLYRSLQLRPAAELRVMVITSLLTICLLGTILFAMPGVSEGACACLIFSSLVFAFVAPLYRAVVRLTAGRTNWWGKRVIIVGGSRRGLLTYRWLQKHSSIGLRPVGIVEDVLSPASCQEIEGYLGQFDDLTEIAAENHVDTAVLAMSPHFDDDTRRMISRGGFGIRHWIVIPESQGMPHLWATAGEVAAQPALAMHVGLLSPLALVTKRAFDMAIVTLGSLLASPLLIFIAVAVRLSSPGPIFYSQERVGRHGRRFRAWKFRSMVPNADQVLKDLLAKDPVLRAEWEADHKLKNDPRITWIGRIIRKTSLDELPQLWNIFRGEMSLVGPRPIVHAEVEKYGEYYEQYAAVTPGLTGLWQISGRNKTTYEQRIEFDAYYVRNWSLWLDLHILVSTVRVVLLREGAF
ncbi:undecaprenyl-phosphate galactose phosphotransferase WbaP [Anatilimnocola floriformis]|uniref:undecaprenyl-phosphate galactose phosphotransferase WbaP n=1 Tax=Anatilimnocola floriformis TaxID=2948575 RepID=UPI0020C59A81|nr:undecaprenyl-phosphate galactose phosphotransferase WbaP [Anatilimnocola floriformis]